MTQFHVNIDLKWRNLRFTRITVLVISIPLQMITAARWPHAADKFSRLKCRPGGGVIISRMKYEQ